MVSLWMPVFTGMTTKENRKGDGLSQKIPDELFWPNRPFWKTKSLLSRTNESTARFDAPLHFSRNR